MMQNGGHDMEVGFREGSPGKAGRKFPATNSQGKGGRVVGRGGVPWWQWQWLDGGKCLNLLGNQIATPSGW